MPVSLARDAGDAFSIHTGCSIDVGAPGSILQVAHHVEAAVDERVDVVGLGRAGVAGFGGDRRLAARARGVLEVARRGGILRAVGGDDDVVEAEREQPSRARWRPASALPVTVQ